METPDKIFLAFEHGFVAQSSTNKKDANGNNIFLSKYNPIEYLRKDTLLEWAKAKYKYYESLYSVTKDPVNWGQRNMCQQLIDKLNSM